jgi:hypothetical protein
VISLPQHDQVSGAKKESIQFVKVQERLKCRPGRQHYDKSEECYYLLCIPCARIMATILFEQVITGYKQLKDYMRSISFFNGVGLWPAGRENDGKFRI